MNNNIIDAEKTFYFTGLEYPYNSKKILVAYDAEYDAVAEKKFNKLYPDDYWGEVIKDFEADMYSLCSFRKSRYFKVRGINLSVDGIYIEDFDSTLFAVVIGGKIVLRYE